jgi:hypothetical protein
MKWVTCSPANGLASRLQFPEKIDRLKADEKLTDKNN